MDLLNSSVRLETYRAHREDDPSVVLSNKSPVVEVSSRAEKRKNGEENIVQEPFVESTPTGKGKRKSNPAKMSPVAKKSRINSIVAEVNKLHPTELGKWGKKNYIYPLFAPNYQTCFLHLVLLQLGDVLPNISK